MELSDDVWQLLTAERYGDARRLLCSRLAEEPDDHWLLTRIGTTFYEEHRYQEALDYEQRALALAPRCPLALWDHAGTLDMLDRTREALRIYDRLIARGPERIATDDCGEGLPRSRGLVADAHYRRAGILRRTDHPRAARNALDRHLAMRGPGCQSIYPLAEVRAERASLDRG